MAKKRRRAGSVTDADAVAAADDPLKRLAAFRERMFDMKHDEKLSSSSSSHAASSSAHAEDAVVLAKWKRGKDGGKAKKRKTMGFNDDEEDDDDAMPRITIKKASSSKTLKKKEKVKKKSEAAAAAVKSSAVKIPGSNNSAITVKKKPSSQESSNFQKWKHENSQPVAVSSAAKGKKRVALGPTKPTATALAESSKPVSPSVVTQDQLAMFEDVLSLEDPLEKAMQAVKEQMAASSSEKKSKVKKIEKKTEKRVKKLASEDEQEQQDGQAMHTEDSNKETKEKTKKRAHVTADSAPEVVQSEDSAQLETENVEGSSLTAHAEQQQEADGKASASHRAKRKRDAVDPQEAAPSSTATAISTSSSSIMTTTTTVEVSMVTAAVSNPEKSMPNAAPSVVKLTANQKKAQKRKARRSQARASSVSLTKAADGAVVSAPVASKAQPEVHDKLQPPAVKSEHASEDDEDSDKEEQPTQGPVASKKQSKVVTAGDAKPTAQIQSKTTTPAKQTSSQVVVTTTEKDAKPVASAAVVTTKLKKKDATPAKTSASPSPLPGIKRQKVTAENSAPRAQIQSASTATGSKKNKMVGSVSTAHQQPPDFTEPEMNTESGNEFERETMPSDDGASDDDSDNESATPNTGSIPKQVLSNLIDEAARQQWDLVEVGRLVKLFSGQWGHKKSKTARFLRRFCPELVNIDFLEGLGVSLGARHLVKIFERGSGNAAVLMNKLASAVENGDLSVRDPSFLNIVGKQVRSMATNHEVLEFLIPLLESLSTVRDVSQLLKHVCEHWHVGRTLALVQQILLTSVFDDLDGNQDEILKDLPQLKGKLDFPSRLDQEDADENGNLIGLIANEDSDLGEEDASDHEAEEAEDALGEIHSEDEDHEDDDDDEDEDEEPYEGETDSEEERAIQAQHRPKRRSRFILDEADEDDDEEEELETEEEEDNTSTDFGGQRRGAVKAAKESDSSSDSDSDDETWRSKPKN
ncbi:hypothetical protein Gpo141_00005473 [Globisporangium polare]